MMALSWGLEQFNHPFGNGLYRHHAGRPVAGCPPGAAPDGGSWFAIETLMSVAAIGALFIGATAKRRWCCCCS
jgi:Cd2+/Zn2+-exporting ATPase